MSYVDFPKVRRTIMIINIYRPALFEAQSAAPHHFLLAIAMPPVQLRLEDPGAPDFAPRVIEILNSTLPVDGAKTPAEAAAALDALFRDNYVEADGADGFLWWFWDLIHDLSRQVPYNSPEAERLASTLQALHHLPTRSVRLGDSWGAGSTVELWQDLPFFGATYREAMDNGNAPPSRQLARVHRC